MLSEEELFVLFDVVDDVTQPHLASRLADEARAGADLTPIENALSIWATDPDLEPLHDHLLSALVHHVCTTGRWELLASERLQRSESVLRIAQSFLWRWDAAAPPPEQVHRWYLSAYPRWPTMRYLALRFAEGGAKAGWDVRCYFPTVWAAIEPSERVPKDLARWASRALVALLQRSEYREELEEEAHSLIGQIKKAGGREWIIAALSCARALGGVWEMDDLSARKSDVPGVAEGVAHAVHDLVRMRGQKSFDVVPAMTLLRQLFVRGSSKARERALDGLKTLAVHGHHDVSAALPEIEQALKDKTNKRRILALDLLGSLGRHGHIEIAPFVERLRSCLRDRTATVRTAAREALRDNGLPWQQGSE